MIIDHPVRRILSWLSLAIVFAAGWFSASLYIGAKTTVSGVFQSPMTAASSAGIQPIQNPIEARLQQKISYPTDAPRAIPNPIEARVK